MTTALLIAGLLFLIAIGVPIAYVLGGTSLVGLLIASDGLAGMRSLAGSYFDTLNGFLLVAIPLYVLMSNILLEGGVGARIFHAANSLFGRVPGGIALATLSGCGAFAAMSGSSVATTTTIGTIALPELRKYHYPKRFAIGLVASGGTLGILIPPSIPLIVYGSMTSESVGTLFLAGIVPGLLSLAIYAIYILRVGVGLPSSTHAASLPWGDRLRAVLDSLWGLMTIVIVLGGIYGGLFTPTEAAAAGVGWALFICVCVHRSLDRRGLYRAMIGTARMSGMVLFIILGAHAFGFVITLLRLPQDFTAWIAVLETSVWVILLACSLLFFVLGMFLDPLSVIAITIPIIYPVVLHYNIDPIWFAILLVKNMELANITPPVGLNVFVAKALDPTLGTRDAFRAILPFAVLDTVTLAILVMFPSITLWLPYMSR